MTFDKTFGKLLINKLSSERLKMVIRLNIFKRKVNFKTFQKFGENKIILVKLGDQAIVARACDNLK